MFYKFTQLDQNKSFLLAATKNSLSTSITLNCKAQEIEQGSDPIEDLEVSGSFPTGLSDSYFSIIYHTDESYYQTLDVDELNAAARTYLSYVTPDVDTSDKVYYGQDSEGIYVAIPTSNSSTTYSNDIYTYNIDGSAASYKVYIMGTCDIIDIGDLPNNVELTLANGYYYDIAGKLYLFLNTALNMVCFSTNSSGETDYSEFWYSGDSSNKKAIISNDTYKNDAYYLKQSSSENATNLALDDDAMMIVGGVIDIIVTSNTLSKIEHFSNCSNVSGVIFSDNLTEIGDYAFYGGSLSGDVEISIDASKVTRIGKYAFSGCPNIKLFWESDDSDETILPASLQEIDDYAFYAASGLKAIDLSKCTSLVTIGNYAFSACGNLGKVTYLESQVELDLNDNTRLLYLPPEQGTSGNFVPRNSGETESVTASYQYSDDSYDTWIAAAETDTEKVNREKEKDDENNNYCFKNSGPSVITWICK